MLTPPREEGERERERERKRERDLFKLTRYKTFTSSHNTLIYFTMN